VRTLVLGLGNEYAGDDAAGVLAVRALREAASGDADVVESASSGLALLEVFAGYDRAVVVDSIRSGRNAPGTIVELALAEIGHVAAPSLHQAGIPELAAVAERLGLRFPLQTRVLAIEVAELPTFGAPLSEPVAAALPELARRVEEQLERWAAEDARSRRPEEATCTTTTQ
jgi:hydrogenase maturation protease